MVEKWYIIVVKKVLGSVIYAISVLMRCRPSSADI